MPDLIHNVALYTLEGSHRYMFPWAELHSFRHSNMDCCYMELQRNMNIIIIHKYKQYVLNIVPYLATFLK